MIVFCSGNRRLPRGRESLSECWDRKWESTHTKGCRDTSALRHAGAYGPVCYTFLLLYNCTYDLIRGCFSELRELKLLFM